MIGHASYMNSYDKPEEKEILESYLEGAHRLCIFSKMETGFERQKVKELDEQIKSRDGLIKELKTDMNSLRLQVIELQLKLGKEKEKTA